MTTDERFILEGILDEIHEVQTKGAPFNALVKAPTIRKLERFLELKRPKKAIRKTHAAKKIQRPKARKPWEYDGNEDDMNEDPGYAICGVGDNGIPECHLKDIPGYTH